MDTLQRRRGHEVHGVTCPSEAGTSNDVRMSSTSSRRCLPFGYTMKGGPQLISDLGQAAAGTGTWLCARRAHLLQGLVLHGLARDLLVQVVHVRAVVLAPVDLQRILHSCNATQSRPQCGIPSEFTALFGPE